MRQAKSLPNDFGDVQREISTRWRELPPDDPDRIKYERFAAEDKARFAAESSAKDQEVLYILQLTCTMLSKFTYNHIVGPLRVTSTPVAVRVLFPDTFGHSRTHDASTTAQCGRIHVQMPMKVRFRKCYMRVHLGVRRE